MGEIYSGLQLRQIYTEKSCVKVELDAHPTSEAPQAAQQDSLVLPQNAPLPCLVTLASPPLELDEWQSALRIVPTYNK